MRSRLEFDAKLRELLGSSNVYFQPPESIKLKFPCIIYKRSRIDAKHADDKFYMGTNCYDVTVISKDPDFPLVEEMLIAFPMSRFDRFFTVDNLNHNIFTIYY